MRAALLSVVREPLVHFAILGALLFGLDAATADEVEAETAAPEAFAVPSGPIVVDAAVRAELSERWAKTHAAPPDDAQLEQLVERWIDEEVLYREGLARSLAEGDSVVRERIASQMAFVLQQRIATPEPTDDDLRAQLEVSAGDSALRLDFTQVFVAGTDEAAKARAQELLGQLRGGADPDGLGDTFAGGRRFRGRRVADLAERFGVAFVKGIDTQKDGTWVVRPSDEGLHLVRIDKRTREQPKDLESNRDALRHDWQQAQLEAAMQQAKKDLRAGWEIVVTP